MGSKPPMRPSSAAFVLVDEPAQHVAPSDADPFGRRSRIAPRLRGLEFETPMAPGLVVVGHVLAKHALEVASTEDERPVQALGPDRANPALGEGVRHRGSDGRLDDLHILGAEHLVKGTGELRVSVPDQESDPLKPLPHRQFRPCWVTHTESGCLVTPATCTRRVPTSMTKSTSR